MTMPTRVFRWAGVGGAAALSPMRFGKTPA